MPEIDYENKNELKRLAAAFKCIGDAVILIDEDYKINYMNRKAEYLTGFSADEAIGKSIQDVFCIFSRYMENGLIGIINEAVHTKNSIGLKKHTRLVGRSGENRYISASFSRIRNYEDCSGVVIVFRDITKIKELEEIAEKERNNYYNIFENMPLGIMLIDKNLEILKVNEALQNLFSIEKENLLGKVVGDALKCWYSSKKGCGKGLHCQTCILRAKITKAIVEKDYSKDQVV